MEHDLDLNALPIFVRVAELHGFSAAARALGLPKSSVSRSVSRLEDSLGVRLVERTTRRLRLTEVGEQLLHHCRRILEEVAEARGRVDAARGEPRGVLRVTLPFAFSRDVLASGLAGFLRDHPAVQLELAITNRPVDLYDEAIDVAVRMGPLPDSSLVARRLGSTRLIFVASPRYLDENGEPRTLEELDGHLTVAFAGSSGLQPIHLQGPAGSHTLTREYLAREHRISVNEPSMVRELTLGGAGVALVPAILCTGCLRDGRLRRILPDWASSPLPVHAVYPSRRSLSPRVRAFVEFLAERLSALEP